jgi:hypothetical protein
VLAGTTTPQAEADPAPVVKGVGGQANLLDRLHDRLARVHGLQPTELDCPLAQQPRAL